MPIDTFLMMIEGNGGSWPSGPRPRGAGPVPWGSPRAPSGFLPTIVLHGVSSAGYPFMRLAPYETRFFRLQKPPHVTTWGGFLLFQSINS